MFSGLPNDDIIEGKKPIMRNGHSTFSAIDCIQNLKKAGFTPEQAEAQAKEFERSRLDIMAVLATKEDVELVRKDIEQLRKETIVAIEEVDGKFKLALNPNGSIKPQLWD